MQRIAQPTDRPLHWILFGLILIFCVFLFMLSRIWLVCYSSVKVETALKQIDSALPHADSQAGEDTSEVTLDIAADGSISLDESDPVTDLSASLRQLVEVSQGTKLLVTIRADEKAAYEDVIKALNALAEARIKNVTFTVGSEEFK
ncbi:ExbD/TolR family protein [Prosthecobacter sp.]|uniref:ExbD/TolR family protein n=1 Tax=Prosthecobacter sp. TaxID=1965333 RepID=UPI00378344A7